MIRGYGYLAATGVGIAVLTACGGPVEVDVPDVDAADAAACEAFTDALPDTLADEERVDIEPADAPAAAYGDPPIVVTCGVDSPEGFGPGAQCELVNDVPWYIPSEQYDDLDLDLEITSAWHEPRVQVVMPADLRGDGLEAGIMAVLSPLVDQHLTAVGTCDL
ncbi:DUF3515 domain-containing protein [Nocardioides bizhenqiangii]|uniref:DUF3515 domain-containing protein n=1 Tax=Nocardioides bizhenqiangii TaxID=3095076 RepID=A0ABZ0ZV04_9ACTN|nr:DUF3515 domain-containing protein [Nocardioides sp. HM61]WQQ28062.1 DUF3515 domain-containing protein [Nocardioides sp. HM61]